VRGAVIASKSRREIEAMRAAGRIVAGAFDAIGPLAAAGVRTEEIDAAIGAYVLGEGGELLFKGYKGFPAGSCISVNEEVVHGIPGRRRLAAGDIVSIDIGVRYKGWCADAARTLGVGEISADKTALVEATRGALEAGIAALYPGMRLVALSRVIQDYVESRGLSVVRTYVGHGIGRQMHEEPQVPNFVDGSVRQATTVLPEGCCLAIEPMVNAGTFEVETLANGWTVVTVDRRPSAHWEDTVAITGEGPVVITAGEK
jgi:methionyl aminopeptidase